MGSLFGKCCSKKKIVLEIEFQLETDSKEYKNIKINLSLIRMENREIRLRKQYLKFRGNINHLIHEEVKFYERIKGLTSRNSCIPLVIKESSQEDSLDFECYEYKFLTLLETESKIVNDIKYNLEKIIIRLLEDLQILNESNIHHLNINPKTLYFSERSEVKLQNFANPKFFSMIFESEKEMYKNIFFINKIKVNWQAQEIQDDSQIDQEKVDIFAIGKLIELLDPEKNSILHRLSQDMIDQDPSQRPTFSKCLIFIHQKGILPKYSIIKKELKPPSKTFSTQNYECKIFVYSYFKQLYEITKIKVIKPEYIAVIRDYMANMKDLSPEIGSRSCFLHVYEYIEKNNTFILITEYYSENFSKRLLKYSDDFRFSIKELWDIFTPLLHGVKEFTEKRIFHGRISCRNLLIDDSNCLKFHGFAFEGHDFVFNQEIREKLILDKMIAPELRDLSDENIDHTDLGKADVYLLGLAWLEVACRVDRNKIYSKGSKSIERFLKNQVNINDEMRNTLIKMLERKIEKRNDILACIKLLTESNRV